MTHYPKICYNPLDACSKPCYIPLTSVLVPHIPGLFTGAEIEKQYLQNKHGYWETRAQRAEEWRDYIGEAISETA